MSDFDLDDDNKNTGDLDSTDDDASPELNILDDPDTL